MECEAPLCGGGTFDGPQMARHTAKVPDEPREKKDEEFPGEETP